MLESAKIIGMPVELTVEEINHAITETVKANKMESCYIRPLFWYGSDTLGIMPLKNKVHFMVAVMPWGAYLGDEAVRKGAALATSSWRRSTGDILPTKAKAGGNYINSVLAHQEAAANGFDEALLLDTNGFITEGSGENIFLINDNVLYPIAHSVNLRGITRDSVIQIAKGLGYDVVPTMATRDEMYTADEAFMVGTAAEVTPIGSLDRRPIGSGGAGPISLKLREEYLAVVSGQRPEFSHWLTGVK